MNCDNFTIFYMLLLFFTPDNCHLLPNKLAVNFNLIGYMTLVERWYSVVITSRGHRDMFYFVFS